MNVKRKLQSDNVAGTSLETKHICGTCEQVFNSDEEYCTHVCPNTDFQPTRIEHQDALTGGRFSQIAEAAQLRGSKREEE